MKPKQNISCAASNELRLCAHISLFVFQELINIIFAILISTYVFFCSILYSPGFADLGEQNLQTKNCAYECLLHIVVLQFYH
jgi:hypothetical protein